VGQSTDVDHGKTLTASFIKETLKITGAFDSTDNAPEEKARMIATAHVEYETANAITPRTWIAPLR